MAPAPPHPSPTDRVAATLRALWTAPRCPWWFVLLAGLVFVLRKTWGLYPAQLYAEDACIFLTQEQQFGLRALLEPYMGYLHLIPRLIAAVVDRSFDPAWWPTLYNLCCLAFTLGLFFRIASPRLDLPGKPLLLLSFALSAHTGEVPLNITNLQWLVAFFLLIQPILSAPTTVLGYVVDALLVVLVGLTGPFSLLLLPVYLWAWWRDRRLSTLLPFLLLAACAALQAHFILRGGPVSGMPEEPFHPLGLFSVIGSRLFAWSFFGSGIVTALPQFRYAAVLLAGLTVVAVTLLVGWAVRPHPHRPRRLLLLLGFGLISAASFYRPRLDSWSIGDLVNGDRYFYIPRVLLFWFLAWASDTPRRLVSRACLALALLGFLLHLPSYHYEAPPDQHWADHCEPIRRGVPAKIPILPVGWDVDYPGRPAK